VASTTSIAIEQPSQQAQDRPSDTTQDQPSPQFDPQGFSWTRQWYVVGIEEDLDPDVPHPIRVLGGRFVLWRDSKGAWHCQRDECPHRLAPLSEGKIVGDSLQCSYHGWRFDGEGKCVHIPQAPASQAPSMCSNRRACASSFPVRSEFGLLWVWPDEEEDRWTASAAQPVALDQPPQDREGKKWHTFLPWYAREFPYSYQTLFDNALDPSHVPWSHHGVIGNRDSAGPLEMKLVSAVSPTGISTSYDSNSKEASATSRMKANQEGGRVTDTTITLHFKAPHTLVYDTQRQDVDRQTKLLAYVTPTSPGRCLVISQTWDTKETLLNKLTAPEWLAHLLFMKAGDGDTVLLKEQEAMLSQEAYQGSWRRFYMPTKADLMVRMWQQWLDKFTQGTSVGPYMLSSPAEQKEAAAPRILSRQELLDRYEQHTKSCPSCRSAMTNFERLGWVAAGAAVVCAQLALLSLLNVVPAWAAAAGTVLQLGPLALPLHVVRAVGLLVGAAVLGKLSTLFAGMRQAFVFQDYVHAHI